MEDLAHLIHIQYIERGPEIMSPVDDLLQALSLYVFG